MILVTVGDDATFDPIRILTQVGEVGQDQIDAWHLDVGKHDAAVEDHDPPPTSMQAQLRPISPRPPRKTIRTGCSATEMGKDLASGVLESLWGRTER